MNDSNATDRDSVEKLADEFMADYRAGRCPSVDEYVVQFPELAEELRGLLQALVILEQNVPPADRLPANDQATDAAHKLPTQIGDFLIVREIGRGGMGVVYDAVQQSLGRQVALKVLVSPGLLNSSHLERFRREARAAARLHHNHIVPVFGFGEHEGTHYYAMQFVPGESLDRVIQSLRDSRSNHDGVEGIAISTPVVPPPISSQNGSPTATTAPDTSAKALSDTQFSMSAGRRQFYRSVARAGLQAAEALAYAHSEGVLHRDIKPSNLLLDAKGNIWITDFGLAKTEDTEALTQSGDFIGTLRYMAPERLEGWSDRRSDLYGLGVTLYELLTLRPLFTSKGRAELVRRIAEDAPLPPRKLDPAIPVDLETIVLKAVAKEPAARYHRAEQMAEDLRRFLADRPILARRSNLLERSVRWCRRNPVVAALATAVAALLVVAVVILTLSNAEIRRESDAKIAALKDREAALAAKAAALSDKDTALGKAQQIYSLYAKHDSEDDVLKDLNKAVELDPKSAENLWLRGFQYGYLNRWDEAVADMTKARPLLGKSTLISPASRDWFVAMAYICQGNRAAYQAECQEVLRKFASNFHYDERGTLVWMCTVTPYALDDPTQLADLAAAVLPENPARQTSDLWLDSGAAYYRAGDLPKARDRLEQTLQRITAGKHTVDAMSEIFANLFLSMTYSRLGLTNEAKAKLTEADRLAPTIQPSCWVDELQQILLTDEARGLLGSSPASDDHP